MLPRFRSCMFLPGYRRGDFGGHYVHEKVGWAVGSKGRPIADQHRLSRYMRFSSVAAANAWIREHPLKQPEANYQTGYCIESAGGRSYVLGSATWQDVKRLDHAVTLWNAWVEEYEARVARAGDIAEALRPLLDRLGTAPRTADRIVRAYKWQQVHQKLLADLLRPKELAMLERAVQLRQAEN